MQKKLIVPLAICLVLVLAVVSLPVGKFISDVPTGKYTVSIGSPTYAAGEADYTASGVDDHETFQTALDSLPAGGGQLVVFTGNYVWGAGQTVTRAIDNVTIVGLGKVTNFSGDNTTPLFAAGGNNWVFSNLSTDAGGIDMGATTGGLWTNVTIDTQLYTYYAPTTGIGSVYDLTVENNLSAAVGRTATYVVAASDAPAHVKAQADYVCDGTADDVEIQAALDLGSFALLTQGQFNASSNITLNTAYSFLVGSGELASAIAFASGTGIVISANGVQIKNLELRGSGSGNGIDLEEDSYESRIEHCYIWQFNYGIYNNAQDNLWISDCRIKGCATGIGFYNGHDTTIQGNQVETCSSQAINFDIGASSTPYGINIVGNLFEDGNPSIATFRGHRYNIVGNIFNRGPDTTGVAVNLNYTFNGVFSGNVIAENTGTQGLVSWGGECNLITDNIIQTVNTNCDIYLNNADGDYITSNILKSSVCSIKIQNPEGDIIAINNKVLAAPVITGNSYGVKIVLYQPFYQDREIFLPAVGMSSNGTIVNLGDYSAVQLADGITTYIYFTFKVPDDFVSVGSLRLIWSTPKTTAANLRGHWDAYYAAAGQVYNTHTEDGSPGNISDTPYGTANMILNNAQSPGALTLPDLAKGDYVGIYFQRLGGDANDSIDNVANVLGFLFTYVSEGK